MGWGEGEVGLGGVGVEWGRGGHGVIDLVPTSTHGVMQKDQLIMVHTQFQVQ